MSEQSKDKRTPREKHLDALYQGFYEYYQTALARDLAPYEKVALQLTTVFFDDLNLLKTIRPLFESGISNVEEKRAAARAAYLDALTIHNRTAGMVFETVSQKDVVKGNY